MDRALAILDEAPARELNVEMMKANILLRKGELDEAEKLFLSHLLTAALVTPRAPAICSWVSPFCRRRTVGPDVNILHPNNLRIFCFWRGPGPDSARTAKPPGRRS